MSVKKHDNDKIYRTIASRYEQEMGEQLLRERGLLEQQTPQADTRRLDELVRRGTKGKKSVKIARWSAVIAACVLIAVLVPLWYPLLGDLQQSDATGAASNAAGESRAEETEELIPLSFTLPDRFTLDRTELDNGLSVYYLGDSGQDPVVMQLRRTGEEGLQTEGLTEIEIAGRPVYGRSDAAYHLLTFETDGLIYTLTCAFDINTLVPLCERIL